MKKLSILFILITMALVGCNKCKNEQPRAVVVNWGTESVSVHIQTSGGNTININNIDSGESSEYQNFAAGTVEFTITVGNGNTSTEYNTSVIMEECFEYEIKIDANNNILSTPTDRNE